MGYDMAKREADAAIRVNNARNELTRLKNNKEKFLEEREIEANEHLQEVNDALETANKFIEKATEDIKGLGKTLDTKYASFLGGLASLLDFAKSIAEKTDNTNRALTKAKDHYEQRIEKLDILIEETSNFKKELTKQKKEVELKSKRADARLKKAKDIAYWHKKGGVVYTDTGDDE